MDHQDMEETLGQTRDRNGSKESGATKLERDAFWMSADMCTIHDIKRLQHPRDENMNRNSVPTR
jgi:hypothetical protein